MSINHHVNMQLIKKVKNIIIITLLYNIIYILICHNGLGTENTVSQRIQTNMHKIGKMVLQCKYHLCIIK